MQKIGKESLETKKVKPFRTIPERAEALLSELRINYPRAAASILNVWDTKHSDKVFDDMVLARNNQDRLGFDVNAFRIIHELQEIHKETCKPRQRGMIVDKERNFHDPWSETRKR